MIIVVEDGFLSILSSAIALLISEMVILIASKSYLLSGKIILAKDLRNSKTYLISLCLV